MANASNNQYSTDITGAYLTDTSETTYDRFNRKPFSSRIAETIISRSDDESLVLGIYGAWGEGKTTVLNYIHEDLKANYSSEVVIVKFNPWRYGGEQELLLHFFTTLADALNKSLYNVGEKVGQFLIKYGALLKVVPEYGEKVYSAIEKYSEADIEKQKGTINQILRDAKKRIVIFIDDIDRLDKVEIQALFRLIKLTADFPYTCYILSFDDEMVASILGKQYGDNSTDGRNFLEKIIQVPLHVPKATRTQIRDYFFELLNKVFLDAGIKLSKKEETDFVSTFLTGIECRLTTPRACKRYVNALTFAIPTLYGEVDLVDLMLLEGMRLLYPELYMFTRNHPEFFNPPMHTTLGWNEDEFIKKSRKLIDEALSKYNLIEKQAAIELFVFLFPAFSTDYKTGELVHDLKKHSQSSWLEGKRLASEKYFNQYFSYAIGDTDVSDVDIDVLIKCAETNTVDELMELIKQLIGESKADSFIIKLRAREQYLTPVVAENLARSVGKLGSIFPSPEDAPFFVHTPFEQAVLFCYKVIENYPIGSRDGLMTQILLESQPIMFSIRLFFWLRRENQTGILDKRYENSLGSLLVTNRIAHDFENAFDSGDAFVIRTYVYMWNTYASDTVKQHFQSYLDNDTKFQQLFNHYFPSDRHNTRDRYDNFTSIFDSDSIVDRLNQKYGKLRLLQQPKGFNVWDEFVGDASEREIAGAYQFLQIYEQKKLSS